MTDRIRFGDLHHQDTCPMPEAKQCGVPRECPWDWACAIDRAMTHLDTDRIVVVRDTNPDDYYVEKP